jgi:4-hydroxy-tetrahydrodipicolinate synthase
MIKNGVYAAGLSVINSDGALNIQATIAHASNAIKNGLHGVFFFGSTGQSQLISTSEKKEFIANIANHKLRKKFYIGTGNNSLNENIELVRYAIEYDFKEFLIMPPAYYKGNTDEGVLDFYTKLIRAVPKMKVIIYNFEKLSGYKFSAEAVTKLVKIFPDNVIGCKDSSYNLFESLKLPNFLMFPGSEAKLLKGLELGCSGCISAVTNVTHSLARQVFDDFENKKTQTKNAQLINVRETFEQYNLISALHSFLAVKDEKFKNILPPLILLSQAQKKELIDKLNILNFTFEENMAA